MGIKNRQRRAAKAKRRAKERGPRSRWYGPHGPGCRCGDQADEPRFTRGERIQVLVEAAVAAVRHGDLTRAISLLATSDPVLVDRESERSLLSLLAERLGSGRAYFFEDRPTALDVYLASAVGVFHPLPESACPMLPAIRHAYETTDRELQAAVGPALLAHRDRMYERHLPLPVQL